MCFKICTYFDWCGCTRQTWEYCGRVTKLDVDSAHRFKRRCSWWVLREIWLADERLVLVDSPRPMLCGRAHHHHTNTFARHGARVYVNRRLEYLTERFEQRLEQARDRLVAMIEKKQPQLPEEPVERPESPISIHDEQNPSFRRMHMWDSQNGHSGSVIPCL